MSPGKNKAKKNRKWIKSQKEIKRSIKLSAHQHKVKYKERKRYSVASHTHPYKPIFLRDTPSFHNTAMDLNSNQEIKSQDSASWYWDNYNKAMQWQNQHFVSFWKGRCTALEAENEYLHKCLGQLRIENKALLSGHKSSSQTQIPKQAPSSDKNSCSENVQKTEWAANPEVDVSERPVEVEEIEEEFEESEEFVFQVNEDVLAFFETSAKHRLELKNQRDAELKQQQEEEMETKESQCPKATLQQRREEMSRIYGSASSMILSMETAMQLSYDRFNDKYQPKLWPNIPFNL